MKRALSALGAAAFLVMLGIVGTVERGGSLVLMWWTIPCLAVMAGAVLANRRKKFSRWF